MIVEALNLSGAFLLKPKLIEDDRGSFFRGFCKNELSEYNVGIDEIVRLIDLSTNEKGLLEGFTTRNLPIAKKRLLLV